jgi:hypothetical protein
MIFYKNQINVNLQGVKEIYNVNKKRILLKINKK